MPFYQQKSILRHDSESSRHVEAFVDTPGLWKPTFWWVFHVLHQKKNEKSKNLVDRPESAKNVLGIKTYVLGGHSV